MVYINIEDQFLKYLENCNFLDKIVTSNKLNYIIRYLNNLILIELISFLHKYIL